MSDLLAQFHKLPMADRAMVKVAALYYQPIQFSSLLPLIKGMGWRDEKGKAFYGKLRLSDRNRLTEQGFLIDYKGMIKPNPELVEPLCELAREEGELSRFIEVTTRDLPASSRLHFIPGDESTWRLLRDVRFAKLVDDEKLIHQALGISGGNFFVLNEALAEEFLNILGDSLQKMSRELRIGVELPLFLRGERWLSNGPEALRRFAELTRQLGLNHLVYELAIAMIQRGDTAGALGLVDSDAYLSAAIQGIAAFMAGQDDQALGHFDEALKTKRKLTRKRKAQLDTWEGVFHALALLRKGAPTSRAQAWEIIVAKQSGKEGMEFDQIMESLNKFLVSIDKPVSHDELEFKFPSNPRSDNPWLDLFRLLIIHWLGGKPKKSRLGGLKKLQKRAADQGFKWFARESALLLKAFGDKSDYSADINALETAPLIDIHRPESEWERTLRILQEYASPTAAVEVGEADYRIAWIVTHVKRSGTQSFELAPMEQKRRANGTGWTKGRSIALRRLVTHGENPNCMTAADRKVSECINEERDSWRYYGTSFVLDVECALLNLIGHPAVIWNGQPVELIKSDPRVMVTRERGGMRIAMDPANPRQNSIEVRETEDKIYIHPFNESHKKVAQLLGSQGIKVPEQAEKRVLDTIAAIAPLITVHSEVGGEVEVDMERIDADGRLHLQLSPQGEGLGIDCRVKPLGEGGPLAHPGEGAESIFGEVDGKRVHARRDLAAERKLADQLFTNCPALDPEGWNWHLDDPEEALETLEALQEMGDQMLLEWPQGKPIRLAKRRELGAMQLKVGAQQEWFALSGELALDDGQIMEMSRLLQLLEGSPGRFVRLGESQYLSLSQELHKKLERLRGLQQNGRIHPLASGLLDEATEGLKLTSDAAWKKRKKRLAEANELQPELPSTLQARLRDYQLEGYQWLVRLAHWGAGACLADDMGLGKTVQTLALLLHRASDGPALVLAPTSVCANWLEEAARFAPTLDARLFGSGDRQQMLKEAAPFSLVICSYGLLQSEGEALAEVKWHSIVADEAQAFKNPQTKRSKAIMALNGEFRMITTGTPIENHLGELWNLFRFINPGLLGSREQFNQRFAGPIEQRNDKSARDQLKRLIRPFILRRIKSDVLEELPEKTEITHHVELSDQERVFYEALRRTALERIEEQGESAPQDVRFRILAEITRLRRACCNPKLVVPDCGVESAKLRAFIEIVEELMENGHKALVFSQFVDHLKLIREWLDQRKIHYQYLDGSTPAKQRQKSVNAFQAGEGELFLISLKAGGSGLNLTAADYVIHLDPWWNPAVEDQASDRAHRIGQKRPVTIYRLVTRDTIEERIIALHHQKRDLADSLLSGADTGARMGVEEMMELLREG
jgi:hypothetical protein